MINKTLKVLEKLQQKIQIIQHINCMLVNQLTPDWPPLSLTRPDFLRTRVSRLLRKYTCLGRWAQQPGASGEAGEA